MVWISQGAGRGGNINKFAGLVRKVWLVQLHWTNYTCQLGPVWGPLKEKEWKGIMSTYVEVEVEVEVELEHQCRSHCSKETSPGNVVRCCCK